MAKSSNLTAEMEAELIKAMEQHPKESRERKAFEYVLWRARFEGGATIPGEGERLVQIMAAQNRHAEAEKKAEKKKKARVKASEAMKGPGRGVIECVGEKQLALTGDFALCLISELDKRESGKTKH